MSLHTDTTRITKYGIKPINSLSCFEFKQLHPQINCTQCSQCDEMENQYGLANAVRKKLLHKTPRRCICNRLKSGLSEWPPFSESDVIQPNNLPLTSKNTSDSPKSSSSDSESDSDVQVVEVAAVPKVRKFFQRVSVARKNDTLIEKLKDEISTLELSVKSLQNERRILFRKLQYAKEKDDITSPVLPHKLPNKQKRYNLACEIISSVKKYYPRTGDGNRASLLLDM